MHHFLNHYAAGTGAVAPGGGAGAGTGVGVGTGLLPGLLGVRLGWEGLAAGTGRSGSQVSLGTAFTSSVLRMVVMPNSL